MIEDIANVAMLMIKMRKITPPANEVSYLGPLKKVKLISQPEL